MRKSITFLILIVQLLFAGANLMPLNTSANPDVFNAPSPWEYFADWRWGDPVPANIQLPPFILEGKDSFVTTSPWKNEISGRVQGGWTPDGLVCFADIRDPHSINNAPYETLWEGDSLEFFITAPKSK